MLTQPQQSAFYSAELKENPTKHRTAQSYDFGLTGNTLGHPPNPVLSFNNRTQLFKD